VNAYHTVSHILGPGRSADSLFSEPSTTFFQLECLQGQASVQLVSDVVHSLPSHSRVVRGAIHKQRSSENRILHYQLLWCPVRKQYRSIDGQKDCPPQ